MAGAEGEKSPIGSRLRWLGLVMSSLLAIGLLFALLFIDARDKRLDEQRQRDFGELRRIERRLREGTATLVNIAAAPKSDGTAAGPLGPLLISVGPEKERTSRCEQAPEPGVLRLCSRGQDRQIWAELPAREAGNMGEANLTSLLISQSVDSRVREVAIIDADGGVLLPLRGDGALPSNLRAGLDTADPEVRKAGPALRLDAQARPQSLDIAGTSYQYYEVPLDLGKAAVIGDVVRKACQPRQCNVAALVAVPGIVEDFRSLSPIMRAIFTGVLVLFLLSTPIVKLVTIDRNASLHWLDVASIGLSVPLITATLTLLVMVLGQWTAMRGWGDATGRDIARTLSVTIGREIDESRRQMAALPNGPQQQLIPFDAVRLFDRHGNPVQVPKELVRNPAGETLGQGFLTQRVALSSGARPGERPYFQRLLRGQTVAGPSIPAGSARGPKGSAKESAAPSLWTWPHDYVVDHLRSIADGSSKLVVAFRANLGTAGAVRPPKPPPDANVLLGIKQLASTMSRPLPSGFGFAIIDPDTLDVVQHSDPSRAHVDSFAEQFRRNRAFEASHERMKRQCATQDRQTGAAGGGGKAADAFEPSRFTSISGVRYNGVKTDMTLLPICNAGWMAVVWYEISPLQAVPVEAGVLAAAMVLVGGLILGGLAVLFSMPGGKAHYRWLWPTPSLCDSKKLGWMLAAAIVWAGFSIASLALLAGDALIFHSFGCVLILVHLARAILPSGRSSRPVWKNDRWAWLNDSGRDWAVFAAGAASLLAAATLPFRTIGHLKPDGQSKVLPLEVLAANWPYLLLVLGVIGFRLVAGTAWAAGMAARLKLGDLPARLRFKGGPTQRRQVVLIISMQAAALVVFGVVPAAAAYMAAWDAKRLVQRDADVERFEAAQATAVQQFGSILANYANPVARPCYDGSPADPWSPWPSYFRGYETDVEAWSQEHGLARNSLRRWFNEPVRAVSSSPRPIAELGLAPCPEPEGRGRP